MKRLQHIVLLLLLLVCPTQAAAYLNLHFHNLNMSHGISDNYVRDICRDSWGMMWFATLNGINSYDGYRFRQYDIKGDRYWNDAIYNIYEDADANLWVRGALHTYVYHREQDFFDADVLSVLKKYGFTQMPESIVADGDGNLWTWSARTLSSYDFAKQRQMAYSLPKGRTITDMTGQHGKAFLLMNTGEVWRITAGTGMVLYAKTQLKPQGSDCRLYMDTSDRLWLYGLHTSILLRYDETTGQWQDMAGQAGLTGKMITAVMDDGDSNIWIGTDNDGIVVMDQGRLSTTSLRSGAYDPFTLADNHIVCFYKDDDAAVIWVGTSKQGAVFANLTQLPISLIQLAGREDVSCISQDTAARLWMGFDSQGIGVYDALDDMKVAGRGKRWQAGPTSISSNQVVCTFTDRQGRQWWGSYGGAPYYIKEGKVTTITHGDLLNYVISICQTHDDPSLREPQDKTQLRANSDDGGTMWFATWDKGLIAMDSRGAFKRFTMAGTIMNTNNITDLAYDGRHTLYVGTSNGLFSLDTRTHHMQQLLQKHVKALYIDKAHKRLWIGLREGVIPLSLADGRMDKLLTVHDGLSHNYVWGFCEDQFGGVWVSTNNGITHIADIDGVFHLMPYYSEDGLGNVRFNNHAITCMQNGDILVGGLGLVVRITPQERYTSNVADYPVRFTGLSVNGERIEVGKQNAEGRTLLNRNIMLSDHLVLHTADRNICLEVTSMNYAALHKMHYVYRLHDGEPWIPVESNVIVLNGLEAGTYQLAVKVAEPAGMEKNPVTTMTIKVLPPFYASWMAYLIYALLIVSTAVFSFLRYKRNIIRQQAVRQREERLRQRQEMNEAKLEFFTQVSHEIRTPLSLVITPLQRLVAAPLDTMSKSSDLKLQLDLILRNAQTLMQEMTKILDVRHLDDILWIKQNTDTKRGLYDIIPHRNNNENQNRNENENENEKSTRKTILIVEDTDDFRMFLHSCLTSHYDVLEAANGQEALEIITERADDISLILSDIMMPVMNGMELCNHVKNDINLSHIPFIMLTARTSEEQVLSGFMEGADDYITKPFNLDILLLRIGRLLKWTASAGDRLRKMDIKPSEITVSNIDQQLIARAIALIEDKMADPNYTIEQFCNDMAMSRSSLYKKLMAITGMSPIHFVRTIRIKRGRQLLETSGESISQIAYKTGLSPKQFAKYFKEEYGISPSELKR